MKRRYLILPLVAGWLLCGCGTAAEASAPCVISWGVQFLAWVGVVAILIFVFGILLLFWPYTAYQAHQRHDPAQ